MKTWIAEKCMRARSTILVEANTRAEAQAMLDRGEVRDAIHTEYYDAKRARVVREDKPRKAKEAK